jgi:hypothetical protein
MPNSAAIVPTLTIALTPARHRRRQLADQHERHLDVDREHGVDVVLGHGRRGAQGEDRRVVDQDVDVPVAEFGGPAGQLAS